MFKNIVIAVLVVSLASVSYYAYQQRNTVEFEARMLKQKDGHLMLLQESLERSRKLAEDCMKADVDRMRKEEASRLQPGKPKK